MKITQAIGKRALSCLLALVMTASAVTMPSYAAEVPQDSTYVSELLNGKDAPYDLMIRFHSDGFEGLSRKEIAASTQQEAKDLLKDGEASGDVDLWESFYITNLIHAEINSKDLVYQLAELADVESITWNGKVERIKPVEDDNTNQNKRKAASASIYQPDERDIEWGVLLVHADKVWDEFSIDGTGATVGIIDGGANYNLPALKKAYTDYDPASGKVIVKEDNPNTSQWEGGAYRDFVDGTDVPQTTTSDDHGTHVAGTIVGAEGENTNRIGVAPGAKFITARAMGVDGGEEADLIAAAEWMLEMKPDVINNSWGGANDDDPWFEDVVDAWVEEGIVPVFASGNTSDKVPGAGSVSNPANYPNVLAVGAVDRDKKIGRFSNKGPSAFENAGTKPEICAPGVQVRSVDSHGSYVSWNGTSMAAPHVAGVVALIRQAAKAAGKEDAYDTLDEIRALLEETAEPLTDSTYTGYPNIAYGYGLVNAYDAVAKIMGRDSVTIQGIVLQDGDDKTPPEPSFLDLNEGYLGRDVQVNVQIKDDVSVRSAKLTYTVSGKEAQTADLTLASGLQNDGVYAYTIPGTELVKGTLALEVTAVDYGNHSVAITKNMEIKPGMTIPWSQDFEDAENGLPGFLMDGCWNFSTRKTNAEPELPAGMNGNGNSTYIGIDAGFSFFDRKIDSNLYLPPIDLSDVSAEEHPSLNVDMYNGFTGISQAKIQVSTIGGSENSWEDLYHVILRPDITDRDWTHGTFSLEKYAGNALPLQIRVYFYGHDADEGVGWYLDNFSVTTNETVAPNQVQALHANISSKGLRVSFDANEETDMIGYSIERKTSGGTFEEIATVDQNLDSFQFINKNEEETRTESHYHVNYLDVNAQAGNTYVYRVRAYDFSGNYGAYSKELEVTYQSYSGNAVYDFEESDGGFQTGVLSEAVNDWAWGKPNIPENVDDMLLLPRTAWSGLAKNGTNVWGSPLGKKPSQPQDSYLQIPAVTVNAGDYLYFDSYCANNSSSEFVSYTVEIKEANSSYWLPLISRETVMDNDQTFTWWQIGASLEDYAGKAVDIRFRTVIDSGYLDAYNLGWHIDNVSIGSQQGEYQANAANGLVPEGSLGTEARAARGFGPSDVTGYNDQMGIGQPRAKASGNSLGTSDGTAGIPIRAKVTVAGSGRYTYSSVIDGSYSIKQAAAGNDSYTLNIEAYGYEPESVAASGTANITVSPVFMTKAQTASLTGQIMDSDGAPLSGASLRLVEDTMAPVLTTDPSGTYTGDAYAGTYTVRVFKDGYRSVEQSITLSAGQNSIPEIRLQLLGDRISEKTDYGYVEVTDSNGDYQTIQFTSGPHGVAVLFQSPHVGGILKSADIFFVKNNYYSGDHIMVGVLAHDEKGRLRELAPFRTVEGITPNAWNTIDFSEFTIETDKPVYVAVTYDKYEFSECMGVYYDTDAQEKAIDKSFIYDGAFTATSSISPAGAYAVKANWLYTEGAATNTENGDDDDVDPPIIDDENAFVFDAGTQTITGYRGSQTKVIIPAKIDGVVVKRIGNEAFSGFGKDSDKKLVSVVIPEGVEEIGVDAFMVNQISSITFPSTLKTIGAGAFKFQYSKDMELTIPASVTVIAESAFQSAASPMTVTMPGVTKIEKLAFDGNRDMKVYANSLTEIADEAFGVRNASDFPYAKVYTAKNPTLTSVNQQHLINPAVVTVMEINSRDSEDVFGKTTLYGVNQTSIGRNQDVSNFYQTGKTVTIAPPDFRKDGKIYSSADKPVTLKLEQENTLTFYYDTLIPRLRTSILDVDKEILGFSLPGAEVAVTAGELAYTTTANSDGFFTLPVNDLTAGMVLTIKVNGKAAGSETVTQYKGEQYITSGSVITRYMGNGGALTLPTAVGSSGSVTEIAPFAFYGVQLTSVVLPDTVETIGTGAFMKTGLKSFGWNLKDINSAKLRSIDEYAFRDNALEKVAMPELTHRIRTGAFENNTIVELQLGKYTGHIGDRAFKNNQIKVLEMSDTAEEIGIEAFMSNQIESLTIKPRLPGYEDGLELIPERAYANNKLTEVVLPKTVSAVDKTAFADNVSSGKRFIVVSDAESIVPTAGYDVRRSNGTLLTWQNGNTTPSPSGGGGGSAAVDSVAVTNPAGGSATLKNGTLTVTPKAGYAVDKVTVNGKEVTLTNGKLAGVKSTDKVVVSFKVIEAAPTGSFVDVPAGAYYTDAVAWAVANGITEGTDITHFSPDAKTTRAQVVTFLYRAAGSPDITATDAFSDVAPGSYYEKAVVWAVANGITNGVRGGRFDPNADCTRAQIVTFLARYAKGTSAGGNNFADVPTDAYYSDAVAWAVANGITDGTSATTFSPDAKCIRAQMAAFLYRLLGAQK